MAPNARLRCAAAGLVASVAAIAFVSPAAADPMDPIPGNGFFLAGPDIAPGLYRTGRTESQLHNGSGLRRGVRYASIATAAHRTATITVWNGGRWRTSVAIKLDQPLVADPEVMRDLVEYDVPGLAA